MTEIENPVITEEHVETEETVANPAAVLRKNRELLADLAKLKARTADLEALAKDYGLADQDLADPRAHVARRAEERKVADARTRTIREAALTKIAKEQRIVQGDVEELLTKLLADANVKVGKDGAVEGLDAVLSRAAPKRAAPGPPDTRKRAEDVKPIGSWEELQALGYNAVSRFASERPDRYRELRADFERRLAKPERRG